MNAGPSMMRSAAAAATAPSVRSWRRNPWRSTARPLSIARHRSIACSTSRSTSLGEGPLSFASSVNAELSTALRMAACREGSHSSRYKATWESVTRRRIGLTRPRYTSPPKARRARTRNVMMEAALNLSASRPAADDMSASSVPATTMTAPRSASFKRQRFRTR